MIINSFRDDDTESVSQTSQSSMYVSGAKARRNYYPNSVTDYKNEVSECFEFLKSKLSKEVNLQNFDNDFQIGLQ